jgi:hypothetical protein
MRYIYKAIPFKGYVVETFDANAVASQLSSEMNSLSADGWEFYQFNSVTTYVSPGCISSLFGAKSYEKKYDMLIFRLALSDEELAKLSKRSAASVNEGASSNPDNGEKFYFLG